MGGVLFSQLRDDKVERVLVVSGKSYNLCEAQVTCDVSYVGFIEISTQHELSSGIFDTHCLYRGGEMVH